MTPRAAHRRAGWLRYAALQFVVLLAIAIAVYPGGYGFRGQFLSELGATHTWYGRSNTIAMALFGVAMASLGYAFVAFAGAWRAFAFDRERGRAVGVASQLAGTLSGVAFVAVGVTPIDRVMQVHNMLVLVAFGALVIYVATLAIVWARNGGGALPVAASGAFLAIVLVHVVLMLFAIRTVAGGGHVSERMHEELVLTQKLVALAATGYVVYVTTRVRRHVARHALGDAR